MSPRTCAFLPPLAVGSRGAYTGSGLLLERTARRRRHARRPRTSSAGGSALVASSALDDAASRGECETAQAVPDRAPSHYVPLHVHSDFSLLDGASHLPDLVARAGELGIPAIALTDHGVLYGAVALVKACGASKAPVKPIIGNEMYMVNVDMPYVPEELDPEPGASEGEGTEAAEALEGNAAKKKRPKPPRRYHLTVLAKNTTGYRNLVQLTTQAHLHGKVGPGNPRPCINKAMLFEHRDGLMVASGCLGGEVAQAILNDRPDVATAVVRWFRDAFGDDYYLEIQDHGSLEDRKVNLTVMEIAKELSIPVIATNDSHFTSVLDAEAHDALICIQTGKTLEDEKRMRYAGNEYFKSTDEMRQCFLDHLRQEDVDIALANTLTVASKVESYDLFGDTRIPDFPIPRITNDARSERHYDDKDHASYLRYVARLGLQERLETRISSGLLEFSAGDCAVRQGYSERLEFELGMIEQMGFSSYFLVVWDYIRFARIEGIPVGPGRGSAAGSIVAFALRITDVDPIEYNLLFERFLNPERKSMPDIDTDFSVEGRERVIRYVTEKYGEDRVAQIITFNRLTSKSVIKDVARVHKVPYADADKLAKMIPVVRGKPATLTKMLGADTPSKDFKQFLNSRPGYMSWLEKARRIEGTNKTFGVHAAGVVISAEPLTDFVPLSKAKHGETITQYPMEDVEALGLLKMDFLGLRNLTVIERAVTFINKRRRRLAESDEDPIADLEFSVDTLSLDDKRTYDFLATGELDGIFQLDASAGMRNIVRELRPSSLDDISSILALYRPGPLDAGLIPKFIRRKHGLEPIVYDHPLLEPILRETYGIMVYQEQIMRIARDLAGYSLGQADILRRAMGKKKMAEMEREQPRFVEGAMKRGVSNEVATKLFETMILFAEYCFNKSHSTAYAYLTYQTAYLKANYPVEYTGALLRANSNQSDKLARYLADANASGVRVLPPSINRSELSFSVDCLRATNGKILSVVLFGLEAIKTVGDVVGRAVIDEREARGPFRSIVDLIERLDSRVLNKRSMGALVMCGAFDELHPNRKVLHEQLETLLHLHRRVRDRKKRRLRTAKAKSRKEGSSDAEQAAIAQDSAEWEEVCLKLLRESETQADFPMQEKLAAEKSTLGFYASGHPLSDLKEAARILDSTPVVNILGELGPETKDDILGEVVGQVESHEAAAVADGGEIMCLSLVSDLKRMITAKGQKMAKWTMEDATGRVSAIVFPSAYTLCEATVTPFNQDSSVFTSDEAAEFVVAEDARVVVWGKVDRESSGMTQVIVDDVQRVEDTHVLIASSPFDPETETNASRSTFDMVQHVARQVQDPMSTYISDSEGQYMYQNKLGEEVVRRRRKKTDLLSKARIPVIVKHCRKGDRGCSYEYAGHGCRIGEVTPERLTELTERTGCSYQLLRIRDILNDSSESQNSTSSGEGINATASESLSLVDGADASTFVDPNVESIAASANSRSFKPPSTTEVDTISVTTDIAISSQMPNHPTSESNRLMKLSSRRDVRSVGFNMDPPEQSTDERDILRAGSGEAPWNARPSVRERSQVRLRKYEHSSDDTDFFSDVEVASPLLEVSERAPLSSRYLEALRARRLVRNAKAADLALGEIEDCSKVEVALGAEKGRGASASVANQKRGGDVEGLTRVENDPVETPNGTSRAVAPNRPVLRSDLANSFNPELARFSNDFPDVDRMQATAFDSGKMPSESKADFVSDDVANAGDTNLFESLECKAGGDCGQGLAGDQRRLRRIASAIFEDAPSDNVRVRGQTAKDSLHTAHAVQIEERSARVDDSVESSKGLPRHVRRPRSSRESEVQVDYGSVGFGGLLDAMCFAAAEISSRYAHMECIIESFSGMEAPALADACHLNVTATVSMVRSCRVYVLLRIRERKPALGRTRTRSLGSAVVTMRASSSLRPLELISLKARKDQELTQTKLSEPFKLARNAGTTACGDVDLDEETTFRISGDVLANACCFLDGGNLLLWMVGEAERIVRSPAKDYSHVSVASIVSFSISPQSDLRTLRLQSVNISTRRTEALDCCSNVQVEIWSYNSAVREPAAGARNVIAYALFGTTNRSMRDK